MRKERAMVKLFKQLVLVGAVSSLVGCSAYTSQFSAQNEPGMVRKSSYVEAITEFEPATMYDVKNDSNDGARAVKKKDVRQIVFTADLYLLVDSISGTLDSIMKMADELDGYMQSSSSKEIVVRVPAGKFKGFVNSVQNLGKVTDKNIVAQDVSEDMMDFNIRLENAEALRKRYAELLQKGGKVEDLIKIEEAMSKITETIERMKGKIRYLKNMVAFSTVTIHLNSSLPQKDISSQIPIEWVRSVGSNIGNTKVINFDRGSRNPIVRFELPKHFMMSTSWYKTNAMSPRGVYLGIEKKTNFDGGDLDFWSEIIVKALEKNNAVKVNSTDDLKLDTGWPFKLIRTEKSIRDQKYSYYLSVVVFKNKVYVYDAWGPREEFEAVKNDIENSMKSMRIRAQ